MAVYYNNHDIKRVMLTTLRMPALRSSSSCNFQNAGTYHQRNGLGNFACDDLLSMSMGPVSAAVAMYAAERLLARILKGQLFRKGVVRKMRRLVGMILERNNVYEVVCEAFGDMM
jgi:hypothetical protein